MGIGNEELGMRNWELGIRNYSSMRTNSVLTPCKVRYFHVTPIPDNKLQRLLRSLVSGGSLRLAPTTPNSSLKLRTNTANLAQSRCGSLVFPFRSPTFPFRFGTFSATRGRRSLAFSEVETGIAAIKTRTAVPFLQECLIAKKCTAPCSQGVSTTMMAPLPSVRIPYLAMSMKIIVARK